MLTKLAKYAAESLKLIIEGLGREWKTVDDIKTVYTKVFGVPQVIVNHFIKLCIKVSCKKK